MAAVHRTANVGSRLSLSSGRCRRLKEPPQCGKNQGEADRFHFHARSLRVGEAFVKAPSSVPPDLQDQPTLEFPL